MARKSEKLEETSSVLDEAKNVPRGFKVRDFSIPLAKIGDSVIGVYVGQGQPRKMKKGKVKTYLVERDDGAKVLLLGAYQLDQFFETVKAKQRVFIKLIGKRKAGRFGRLNEYMTAVEE